MITQQLDKGSLQDVFLVFDLDFRKATTSLLKFKEQYETEDGQYTLEQLQWSNQIQIYINENTKRTKKKIIEPNIQDILQKYSKDKQLGDSNLRQLQNIRTLHLNIMIIDRTQYSSLDELQVKIEFSKVDGVKNIVILEEVKEWVLAQNICSKLEFDGWILDLQILNKVDNIITKSSQHTQQELVSCINSTIQQKKKNHKQVCLFRNKVESTIFKSEVAGITNSYQLMWLQMLIQIHGISENKARAIVLKYPSIQQLLMAYEQCPIDDRPYLLSGIEVTSGIMQNKGKTLGNKLSELIFQVFSNTDPSYLLFD